MQCARLGFYCCAQPITRSDPVESLPGLAEHAFTDCQASLHRASRYDSRCMNPTASSPSGASPALAAFLGGSARRALVLAELQCGDSNRGDAAAMALLPAFAAAAADHPLAQWPRLFWSGLLAQPGLRPAGDVRWPAGFAGLAGVGPGARAALLLWLVAGLGDEEAAAVGHRAMVP